MDTNPDFIEVLCADFRLQRHQRFTSFSLHWTSCLCCRACMHLITATFLSIQSISQRSFLHSQAVIFTALNPRWGHCDVDFVFGTLQLHLHRSHILLSAKAATPWAPSTQTIRITFFFSNMPQAVADYAQPRCLNVILHQWCNEVSDSPRNRSHDKGPGTPLCNHCDR
jgi:hypothetical protein